MYALSLHDALRISYDFAVTAFSSTRPCEVGCRASRRPPTACRPDPDARHAVGGRRDALHPTAHGRVEENPVTAKPLYDARASYPDVGLTVRVDAGVSANIAPAAAGERIVRAGDGEAVQAQGNVGR